MKTVVVALIVGMAVPGIAFGAGAPPTPMLAQAKAEEPVRPATPEVRAIMVRGIVDGIDKEKLTVIIKNTRRTLLLNVRDPRKLDALKVGTPVVARFYPSVLIDVKKKPAGASPGTTAQPPAATPKPGEPPATVGRRVTVTTAIVALDERTQTVTFKGPEGHNEIARVKDPKILETIKVGDLVEITYTQRLAISLDPTAAQPDDAKPSEKK